MEFIETYKNDGNIVARLVSPDLPTATDGRSFLCTITVDSNGATVRTRANGNGSIRCRWFRSYTDAQEAAIKWAKRKIAEQRRRGCLWQRSLV